MPPFFVCPRDLDNFFLLSSFADAAASSDPFVLSSALRAVVSRQSHFSPAGPLDARPAAALATHHYVLLLLEAAAAAAGHHPARAEVGML
jgi:hypothetical protein